MVTESVSLAPLSELYPVCHVLTIELTKVMTSIVMFEVDVMANVSRLGRFKNVVHSQIRKILPSCCGNTNRKTQHKKRSAEKGRGYIRSINRAGTINH